MTRIRFAVWCTAAAMVAPHGAMAQISGGLTAATFTWEDGRSEQALGAVLQMAPAPWLVIGAVPTVIRVRSSTGADAHAGLGDLPVYGAVVHAGVSPARPTVAFGVSASLPTGDASTGLGRGISLLSGEATASVDPAAGITVRAGGARLLRAGGEAPRGVATTTLFGDVVFGSRSPTSFALGAYRELQGQAPDGYDAARGLTASLAHALRGGATLLLGAGRTLAGAGPDWSFSLGIGTAFGGVAPVGATAPVSRGTAGLPGSAAPGGSTPLCIIAGC